MLSAIRSYRNNNPGNIRNNASFSWDGQTGSDSSGFVIFSSPEFGFRALSKLLSNYARLYGANTIAKIIPRYAPSVENDTEAYIGSVENQTGINRHKVMNTPEEQLALIKAISKHEAGFLIFSDDTIRRGMELA